MSAKAGQRAMWPVMMRSERTAKVRRAIDWVTMSSRRRSIRSASAPP
jgi:hypothetical protein